jgi:hypothetical protein
MISPMDRCSIRSTWIRLHVKSMTQMISWHMPFFRRQDRCTQCICPLSFAPGFPIKYKSTTKEQKLRSSLAGPETWPRRAQLIPINLSNPKVSYRIVPGILCRDSPLMEHFDGAVSTGKPIENSLPWKEIAVPVKTRMMPVYRWANVLSFAWNRSPINSTLSKISSDMTDVPLLRPTVAIGGRHRNISRM